MAIKKRLRIGDFSDMTRLSPSGIRFYEDLGIIQPSRDKNQKYRDFTERELDTIFAYKCYRNSGFEHEETLILLKSTTEAGLIDHILSLKEKIIRNVAEKNAILTLMDLKIKAIEQMKAGEPFYQIEANPELRRIKLKQEGHKNSEYTPQSYTKEWFDRAPFVDACLLFSPQDIMHTEGLIIGDLGVAIEEHYAKILHFDPVFKGERIPEQECIHTYIKIKNSNTLHSNDLYEIRSLLDKLKFTVSNDAICRRLYNIYSNSTNERIDHIWIPVKSDN